MCGVTYVSDRCTFWTDGCLGQTDVLDERMFRTDVLTGKQRIAIYQTLTFGGLKTMHILWNGNHQRSFFYPGVEIHECIIIIDTHD